MKQDNRNLIKTKKGENENKENKRKMQLINRK